MAVRQTALSRTTDSKTADSKTPDPKTPRSKTAGLKPLRMGGGIITPELLNKGALLTVYRTSHMALLGSAEVAAQVRRGLAR